MPPDFHLPPTVVGIDIETTALDATKGDIIEVAAIRYDLVSGREIARFETLCRSRHPVTEEITSLTGITPAMVVDQPLFAEVIPQLQAFLGDDIVFAHNASFDLEWLQYHGLTCDNPVWDTFPLAAIAWPEAESYNLGTLAQELNIERSGEHRAAADVVMTWQLLQHIRQQLIVNERVYQDVSQVVEVSGLTHYGALFSVGKPPAAARPSKKALHKATGKPITSLAGQQADGLIGPAGKLVKRKSALSYRAGQLVMAGHVSRLLTDRTVGIIEAEAGSGKTIAYLVPSLLALADATAATTSDSGLRPRVVISTHTRHLQDQLVERDIPGLLQHLGVQAHIAVLKGRRNYICSERVRRQLARATLSPAEGWMLLKVLLWVSRGANGDIERLNISHQDNLIWRLHADSVVCRRTCRANSDCPYQQARRLAKQADLVVTNHVLLMQSADTEESEVRTAPFLIIDEAHHLAEAARLASRVDLGLERVGELLATGQRLVKKSQSAIAKQIKREATGLLKGFEEVEAAAGRLVVGHTSDEVLRLSAAIRRSRNWQQVAAQGEAWLAGFRFFLGLLKGLDEAAVANAGLLKEVCQDAEAFSVELQQFLAGNSARIQWLRLLKSSAKAQFVDVALDIRPYSAVLLEGNRGVVLTSGTLSVEGSLNYFLRQLALPEATEAIIIPTEYDVKQNMGIFIVEDAPQPGSPSAEKAVADTIIQIANTLHGRVLGLFTSHTAVRAVYNRLIRPLNKAKIKLYAQKLTGGRHNITKRFRDTPASVLLGTASFWEGLDVPGDSLSCVVIPRLPFSPPTDPVMDAIKEQSGTSVLFEQYIIPHVTIRMKQGVGRLLRSPHDRGVIVIMDPRILTQSYGQKILRSFPPAPVRIVSRANIQREVAEWFGAPADGGVIFPDEA